MTGALVSQTGDITVENISTEETLEKVLKAAENINNTLKTNTTSVNTAQVNSRFNKLSETTSGLNKSFTSLTNSVADISKKLGTIDVSHLTDSVDDIRKNLDQTAEDIGGFSGNLFDIAGSARGATEALNLFEVSSGEMSAGASEAGAAATGLSKKATVALVALDLLASTVGGVVRILGGFLASAVKLVSQFVMGENKLSAYTETVAEALSSIPYLGGILGSLVGIVAASIKVMEGYRDVQAQLAESGAAFGQDLMYMRSIAEKTGLGMEGFAGVIGKNTEIFAKFGSVSQGAVLFAKTTAILRDRMRDMGYSIEDINEGLAQVMSLNTAGAAVRNQSDQALADTAQRLMTEMDAMAKLTGQSRRSQAEAIKKQQMTAAYQMALAKMDSTSREMVNQEMMQMQAVMGDIGAEMVKLRVLGLQPFTNEQIMATTTMGRAVSILNNTTDLALKGKLNQEKLDEKTADILEAAGDDALRVKDILRVAAAGLGGSAADISKNFDELYTRMGQFVDNTGKLDRKRFIESLKTIREEQKKRDLAAQSLNKFENSMMKLRTVLIDKVLTPLYNIFAPMLMEFAEYFEKNVASSLASKLDYLGEKIIDFGKSLAVLILKISDAKWWETMIDDIGIKFQEMILDIRRALPRHMGGLYDEEVKAQKQMLQERREQNKVIREVEDERARARIEGRPVNLSEEKIQQAYQAEFSKAKDYEKNAEFISEYATGMKKLIDSQQRMFTSPEQKIKDQEEIEKYKKQGMEKIRKNLSVGEDFVIDFSKTTDQILNDLAEYQIKTQYKLEKIAGGSIYEKFRTKLRTAESFDFLKGFQEAGVRRSLTEGTGVTVGKKGAELEADVEFKKKIDEVSAKLKLDPQKLIAMMKLESGLEAGIVNRYSGATGLIQFMPKTAKGLGTSVEDLGKMTALEQMKYVEMYLERALSGKTPQGEKFSSSDLYASVFWPAAVGKPEDFIIAEKGNPVYDLNHILDVNKDGKIQKSELGEKINQRIKEPSRSSGTLGSTGKLFEDFGKGTKVTAHNLESIMTPSQLREIVTASQERLSSEVVSKIMGSNTEVQNRMVNLLSQIREILGDSYRYHREIANNI